MAMRKLWIGIFISIFLGLSFYFFIKSYLETVNNQENIGVIREISSPTDTQLISLDLPKTYSSNFSKSSDYYLDGDVVSKSNFDIYNPVQTEEIEQWCRSRGLYLMGCLNGSDDEYAGYDFKMLESLVAAGDMRAYGFYLKEIMRQTPEGFDNFKNVAMDFAAKGSLDAIGLLGFFTKISDGRFSSISKRENELEFIAIYKLAEIRGNQAPMLLEVYSSIDSGQIQPLTAEEWKMVDDRAEEYYQELAKRRNQLGLENFDNSTPDSVSQYFMHLGGNQYK